MIFFNIHGPGVPNRRSHGGQDQGIGAGRSYVAIPGGALRRSRSAGHFNHGRLSN